MGWCWTFWGEVGDKSPPPHHCQPPSQGGGEMMTDPCPYPAQGEVWSLCLPPFPKHPWWGCEQELPPRGLARQWKTIRTEWQNQYLVRLRGDYRFFSHDIHVSCTSCFSGALEIQVPPRPRVARLWLCNICTSQEVHVWSPGLMLVHLSGSRDMLAWGLLGKPGGSRTAGDAEGNDTGSLQGSTTWICCQLLPQLSPSQPYGYITVLTSNFLFNPSHLFSLGFLALLLSVPKDFYPGQRQPWAPHN